MTEIIKLMATKLGFSDETAVIGKACEYDRLLKLKMFGGNNISDSAKSVICLDLAAASHGLQFDVELAVKLAAIKKSAYANTKHNIKKVLNIEEVVNINSLCVQFGCTQASATANQILDWFKKIDIKNSDLAHPQFACMAVFQACRLQKIKVSKSKLIPCSHLKPSQWNNLEAEWTKMVDEFSKDRADTKSQWTSKNNKNVAQVISDNFEEKSKLDIRIDAKSTEDEAEDYEVWKKRILEQAYEELEMENKKIKVNSFSTKDMTSTSPARVDREKGIRLVFK